MAFAPARVPRRLMPWIWVVSTAAAVSPLAAGSGIHADTDALPVSGNGLAAAAGTDVMPIRDSSPWVETVLPLVATLVQRISASSRHCTPVSTVAPVVTPFDVTRVTYVLPVFPTREARKNVAVVDVAVVVMYPRAVTRICIPVCHPWNAPSTLTWATSAALPVTGDRVAVAAVFSVAPGPDPCGVEGVISDTHSW